MPKDTINIKSECRFDGRGGIVNTDSNISLVNIMYGTVRLPRLCIVGINPAISQLFHQHSSPLLLFCKGTVLQQGLSAAQDN